jgi:hypothetical protein
MAKLTLSLDKNTIERAKEIARANGISVSAMFTRFVQFVEIDRRAGYRIGSVTRNACAIADLPSVTEYRELLSEALAGK